MKSSEVYYQLTDESYLALCPERSSHMNLGLWPADSIKEAQGALVAAILAFHRKNSKTPPMGIVDGGSGWGGARILFEKVFPGVPYLGINSSLKQIGHATQLNAMVPNTRYLHGEIENLKNFDLGGANTFISIEAAFHFENKDKLIADLVEKGIRSVTIADICSDDKKEVMKGQYLSPALDNSWSTAQYLQAFEKAGFSSVVTSDITRSVFSGWAKSLEALDPKSYGGRPKMLRQFLISFGKMADLARAKALSYQIFHGEL